EMQSASWTKRRSTLAHADSSDADRTAPPLLANRPLKLARANLSGLLARSGGAVRYASELSAWASGERRVVHEADCISTGIDERERALAPVLRLDTIVNLLTASLPSAPIHGVDVGNGEEDLLRVRCDLTTPSLRVDAGEDSATTVKVVTIWR